ncbi:membrane-associated progesterone receptor component 1 [Xyrichtys novacula]|uniref:Membrane-associated progesterone receptor component 1 n=1 Tax=Xyrichtys novacula TaxID=13765 RepID=A0AAV1FR94_XYRNO|nr:membrane-associated progesterone receptor component 1 [Xyrichtys novacula]
MAEAEGSEITSGGIFQEIFTSPLNLTLLSLCLFLLYKIFRGDKQPELGDVEPPLPKMKRRDFTLADLKPYDGLQNPRILMAVNGKVFDVTRGKKFYGPVKYDYVGKLLKPGEEPTEYTDDEEGKDKKED